MFKMKFALALAAAALPATPALSFTIYAIDNNADTLLTLDRTTGAKTVVGSLGTAVSFGDLAWDGSTLYLLGGRNNNALYSVDRTTGAATLIGSHGVTDLFGLAYNPLDGHLYATQFAGGSGFYRLDKLTGAATPVVASGTMLDGLAFNSTLGTLVGAQGGQGAFFSVDAATGDALQIGAGAGFLNNGDLDFDAASGAYYVADFSGFFFRYSTNTQSRTIIASGLGAIDGLAIVRDVTAPIPEPASWAMMITGFGLIGGTIRRRASVDFASA